MGDAAQMDDLTFARRLSSGYGLIQLPCAELAARLAGIAPPDSQLWSLSHGEDAASTLRQLTPLSHPARRYLVVPIGAHWCAVVDNRRAGPDFADLQRWLEPWTDVLTVRVVDRAEATTVTHGFRERTAWSARILVIRGPGKRRSIACSNDGGRWVFETSGEPLPIEASFPYEARRKSDRFGSDQLGAVLEHLGTRRLSSQDLMAASQSLLLQISHRDPMVQMRMERSDCTPEEAEDPAFGYWLRATTWIEHIESHAESAVMDLTRAVALNPAYAERAHPHLERARSLLGASTYEATVDVATSLLTAAD